MQKKMIDTAIQRSNIYGFLSLIYRSEVTKPLLAHLKRPGFSAVLEEMGVRMDNDFVNSSEDRLIEDLAVEYTRLFIGPGPHISPHESVHHKRDDGDWGALWGRSTVEVKKFIESSGLEYTPEHHGMPDHISVEFEFMQAATKREEQSWKESDLNGAGSCLKLEKMFIDEHLKKWVPVFCDKVIADAELSFYREMAGLTKSFIELESNNINEYIAEADTDKIS